MQLCEAAEIDMIEELDENALNYPFFLDDNWIWILHFSGEDEEGIGITCFDLMRLQISLKTKILIRNNIPPSSYLKNFSRSEGYGAISCNLLTEC